MFNKVLVKIIHTATIEGEDPAKVVNRYLAQYKASPHKTTGKSPFELMFGRKMRTKLPERRGREEEEVETRKKHDEAKLKQKEYVDGKKGTREKILKPGDKILLQRKKTTTKSPWDPVPYEVEQVKGSEITARRGDEVKRRAKNNVKPVKPRPQFFQAPRRMKNQNKEEEDLEGDLDKILGRTAPETRSRRAGMSRLIGRQGDLTPEYKEERNWRTCHSISRWRSQLTRSQNIRRKRNSRLKKRLRTKRQGGR